MRLEQIYATYEWRDQRSLDDYKYCPRCGAQLVRELVDRRSRLLCTKCGFIHYRNPYPVISVLLVQDGKVLLGKRSGEPGAGKWALPSGYIEFEDDFLSAAMREVKEETGLEAEMVSILNIQSAFLPPQFHFFGVYLLGKVTGGKLEAGDDLEQAEWFPLSGPLPEMAFPPEVELIQAYQQGEVEGITIGSKPWRSRQ